MAYEKRKVILTVAQTGNFQGKAQNPNLPEQPHEIIQSAYDCYNAGASIVHVHARNKEGKSCNDPNIFAEINTGIRAKCPIIVQNSSAPATRDNAQTDDGLGVLDIKDPAAWPEMCSLDCSLMTTTWGDLEFIYMWTRKWLINTARRIKEMGIGRDRGLRPHRHRGRVQVPLPRRRAGRPRVPDARHGHGQGIPGRDFLHTAEHRLYV